MLNNDEPNVQLNSEQLKAIEESSHRLLNLESEISIAQKNIRQLKAENERAIKDKSYQEELLTEVTNKVGIASVSLVELKNSIENETAKLNQILSDYAEYSTKLRLGISELNDREMRIGIKEREVQVFQDSVEKSSVELEQEVSLFNEKVSKLKDVINDF